MTQKLTYAQKALRILAIDNEVNTLRQYWDASDQEVSTWDVTLSINSQDGDPWDIHQQAISHPEKLKSWINEYMPILLAEKLQLETEINQHNQSINS